MHSNQERAAANAAYSDGQPFDEIRYFQPKVLLKPDRFTALKCFRDFGKLVRQSAKNAAIGFEQDPEADGRPNVREIAFVDTPDFLLYKHGFILRRRVSYVDGFAVGEPEIVFKFRHGNERTAAAVDVRPQIEGSYRIKFKAQELPQADHIGGHRMLYSHNCQFPVSHVHEGDRTAVATLTRVFPVLTALRTSDHERVSLVNEGFVEELLVPVGLLHFGKGTVAKSTVSLWRTRADHKPLVGEFSFQIKFETPDEFSDKARAHAKQFFITLQHHARDWISRGTTKTGLVYGLKRHDPEALE